MLSMFKRSSGGSSAEADAAASTAALPPAAAPRVVKLLVIQSDAYDWPQIFKGTKLADGSNIEVQQAGWEDIQVNAETTGRHPLMVHIRKSGSRGGREAPGIRRTNSTFLPDFVLVRNEVRTCATDYRPELFGLMFGGVGAANSLGSIHSFCERPVVHAELGRIQRELGHAAFPVVEQSYFSRYSSMMYGNSFPAVVKVGHAHAGMGKMRIADHHDMEDFRSVLAMTEGKYCTAEPFLQGTHDLRIQKIGPSIKVFKRTGMCGQWKTNTGTSIVETVPTEPRYAAWANAAAQMFGGLDICTVDVLCDEQGKEWILEVNGTSSGLCPEHEDADNRDIRDLIVRKLDAGLLVAAGAAGGGTVAQAAGAAGGAAAAGGGANCGDGGRGDVGDGGAALAAARADAKLEGKAEAD